MNSLVVTSCFFTLIRCISSSHPTVCEPQLPGVPWSNHRWVFITITRLERNCIVNNLIRTYAYVDNYPDAVLHNSPLLFFIYSKPQVFYRVTIGRHPWSAPVPNYYLFAHELHTRVLMVVSMVCNYQRKKCSKYSFYFYMMKDCMEKYRKK